MIEINAIEKTRQRLIREGRMLFPLYSGNPGVEFQFPPAVLEKAYQTYFKNPMYDPHPRGEEVARLAISSFYQKRGFGIRPDRILITSGSSESFLHLFRLVAQPGDEILAPLPGYPLFDHFAERAHVVLKHYPLIESQNWEIDLKTLKESITLKTRAILLISPHNPTGSVISAETAQAIAALANEFQIPLICDEVFSEFYYSAGAFPRIAAVSKPNLCFTLNGISKIAALPMMKLGWIAVSGEEAKVEAAIQQLELDTDAFLACHTPIQKALPEILEAPFLPSYWADVKKRRDAAVALLKDCPHFKFTAPEGGFYLIVRVTAPIAMSEEEFVIELMEETGIFVHPGYFYDAEPEISFVLSFLAPTPQLKAALNAIHRFIEAKSRPL